MRVVAGTHMIFLIQVGCIQCSTIIYNGLVEILKDNISVNVIFYVFAGGGGLQPSDRPILSTISMYM